MGSCACDEGFLPHTIIAYQHDDVSDEIRELCMDCSAVPSNIEASAVSEDGTGYRRGNTKRKEAAKGAVTSEATNRISRFAW